MSRMPLEELVEAWDHIDYRGDGDEPLFECGDEMARRLRKLSEYVEGTIEENIRRRDLRLILEGRDE